MQRGYQILIAGAFLIISGLILILPSAYNTSSLLNSISANDMAKLIVIDMINKTEEQSVSKDSSLFDLLKIKSKNLIIKGSKYLINNDNQTSSEELLRKLAYNLGLNFFIILVGIILIVNGLISLIGGTIIFVLDRRKTHQPKV
jgi:sulfite exporter TauE/SafE